MAPAEVNCTYYSEGGRLTSPSVSGGTRQRVVKPGKEKMFMLQSTNNQVGVVVRCSPDDSKTEIEEVKHHGLRRRAGLLGRLGFKEPVIKVTNKRVLSSGEYHGVSFDQGSRLLPGFGPGVYADKNLEVIHIVHRQKVIKK